jgi:hypothetical protein
MVGEGSIPLFIIALLRGIDHDKALRCLAFIASNQINNMKTEQEAATCTYYWCGCVSFRVISNDQYDLVSCIFSCV